MMKECESCVNALPGLNLCTSAAVLTDLITSQVFSFEELSQYLKKNINRIGMASFTKIVTLAS